MKLNKLVSKKLFKVVLTAALFGGGVLAGKFISFDYFVIDKEISLVDLFSIFVTVFIAWYISEILETEKEQGRTEKNLILKRTDEVYQFVDKGQHRIATGNLPLQEITSHLKRIHVSLKSISKILIKTKIKTDKQVGLQIAQSTQVLRGLMTYTPIENGSSKAISVVDGIVNFSQARISEIEGEYDKLKDGILLLEISINKA